MLNNLNFKNSSYVCVSLCTTAIQSTEHNTQNSSDILSLILQTIIITQMTSYWRGRGKSQCGKRLLKQRLW